MPDHSRPAEGRTWPQGLAEAELHECHQHYRAAADQAFKAVAFLATAFAVLLTLAFEQRSALALAVAAIIPLAGKVIAIYIGRQFGAALSYGTMLERFLHGAPTGFFWGHYRSATGEVAAANHQQWLEDQEPDKTPPHVAWTMWSPPVELFVPLSAVILLVLAVVCGLVFDWDWV